MTRKQKRKHKKKLRHRSNTYQSSSLGLNVIVDETSFLKSKGKEVIK